MSKSIRTKVSTVINNEVYNDNQLRVQFENMEMYDSVVQQLNEIEGMIDATSEYVNTTALIDLSNLKIDAALLSAKNTIIEPAIASLTNQVNALESSTTTTSTLKINVDNEYLGNITLNGNVRISSLTTDGLVRVDAAGNLVSGDSYITNDDIAMGAGIVDSKLETISDAGKVSVSATTATVPSVPNTILLRDVSGHIFAKTQTNITDILDTTIATTAYVKNTIATIIDNAPGSLNTLNELAAALNDDTNYASSVMSAISLKAYSVNPVLTGNTVISNVSVKSMESLDSGLLATNSIGVLRKETYTNALASVVVSDSQLDIITTPGKVANSALKVSTDISADTIVLRDSSGNMTSTFVNNVLVQNKHLLTDPSFAHIAAGPYSQGWKKMPMPSKGMVTNATTKWVIRRGANANPCTGLCWAPELKRFVGVGYSQYIVSSNSGISWDQYDTGYANDWNGIEWSYRLNQLVAVAASGTNRVMTSPDGTTWTLQNTTGANYSWSAIIDAEELGLLVAVSTDAGNSIMTSPDAITWTMRPYSGTYGMRSVCWAKELNMFVAPEFAGNGNSIAYSYNGVDWQQLSGVLTNAVYWSVCWSPERRLFVIVGGTNNIAISNDGVNWTNTTISNSQGTLQKVVWSSQLGVFVAVCSGASNRNLFWVSETGLQWKPAQIPTSSITLNSLTMIWSPELSIFCSITSNGTIDEKVITNSLSTRLVNPTTVFDSPYMSVDNSGNWTIPNIATSTVRVNNLNTQGINNTLRTITTTNLNLTGTTARLSMATGATPGYTMTAMDSTGAAMWLPYKNVPHQINGNVVSNSVDIWTAGGQTKTLGNITLPPGNWSVNYKTMYSAEPTYGYMVPSASPIPLSTEPVDVSNTNIVFKYTFNAGTLNGTNNFANFATGSPVYDASGFNGASITTSDYTVGTGALQLIKSSSQYMQLPTFTSGSNGITISFWFKHNTDDTYARLFDFGNDRPSDNLLYCPKYGASLFIGSVNPIAGGPALVANATKNVWHFFVWSIPYAAPAVNTTHTFYFDGQSTTVSAPYPTDISRTRNYIGQSNWIPEFGVNPPGDPYIDAIVDDFRWYNRTLSSAEINTLYTRGYPPINNIVEPFNYYTLKLDGTKSLQLKNYTQFNLTTAVTMECWIYPTSYYFCGIISKEGNYTMYMRPNGVISMYDWANTLTFIDSTIIPPLNSWSHIAITISSGTTNGTAFYLNGVQQSTTTYTLGTIGLTYPFLIGSSRIDSERFNGYISNARIWNYARSSAEISANYNKLIPSATGLIASLYLNDLPTSFRTANNVYPSQRLITRSIAGLYVSPDISTNEVSGTRVEDWRTITFTDSATTGRGIEESTFITNSTDANITYYLNGYIDANSAFNVGNGRSAGQTYLYAIREATNDYNYYFKQYYPPINYTNFNSTTGLVLLSAAAVSAGDLNLTTATNNQVGNMWTTWNANYNSDFKITFRMNLYGGAVPPADGFCIQWHTANNAIGVGGGGCGAISTAKYAVRFLTYSNNRIELVKDGNVEQTITGTNFYGDFYYWIDYNYLQKQLNVYVRNTNVKPAAPSYIFTSVDFPADTPYYIGFGAATGGSNEVHALKSFSLEIISYKIYYILPPVTPTNIGVMGRQSNQTVSVIDTIYSGNSYDLYRANQLAYNNLYFNMNYLNGNYITYNNGGNLYYHHRDASNISFAAAARVYVRGYTGPVFQLRRASDDALQDFYTDEYQTYLTTLPNGAGTTFATWVGASTAYVRIWYNQNGVANHATNLTSGNTQPYITLNNNKYVLTFDVSSAFLQIKEPITPNTLFCEFYNTNTQGTIATYMNTSNALFDYQQRFDGLLTTGPNNTVNWYSRAGGTKLSYVDGTSTTSMTAWGSWKTVALSSTIPDHRGGGFSYIGRGFSTSNSMNGFMSQIVFHNRAMQVGNMVGFHHERLIV